LNNTNPHGKNLQKGKTSKKKKKKKSVKVCSDSPSRIEVLERGGLQCPQKARLENHTKGGDLQEIAKKKKEEM